MFQSTCAERRAAEGRCGSATVSPSRAFAPLAGRGHVLKDAHPKWNIKLVYQFLVVPEMGLRAGVCGDEGQSQILIHPPASTEVKTELELDVLFGYRRKVTVREVPDRKRNLVSTWVGVVLALHHSQVVR